MTKEEFTEQMSKAGHGVRTCTFVWILWGQTVDKETFLKKWRDEVQKFTHPNARSNRRGLELYRFLCKFGAITGGEVKEYTS